MSELKYKVIKSDEQYFEYCNLHEQLLFEDEEKYEDEIELLYALIEKYDNEHSTLEEVDPIALLKYLMEEQGLKAKDLVELLGLSKGTVSKILNYQKGLSKQSIRILAERFKLHQEAFNRPYPLKQGINSKQKEAS